MKRVVLLATFFGLAAGAQLVREFEFESSRFKLEQAGRFVLVLGVDQEVTDDPGAPQLPVVPAVLALPGECRASRVLIDAADWQELAAAVTPYPAQEQHVLADQRLRDWFTSPNAACYSTTHPSLPGRWTGTSVSPDSTLVQLLLYPVRFVGARQRLEYCPRIKVEVTYERLSQRPVLPTAELDYVIVTGAGLDSVFERLAQWKTQKGVRAAVRNIGWVTANYPGRDDAERLRNYLKTLPDSGVRYVLLGGDVGVIPFRKAFAMSCEWGAMQREDSLPCDLYFADLQGDWDANGNSVFGETDDGVDLYADIAVGRAPVNNAIQAQAFVRKVLDYEQCQTSGYQQRALFFAEILWQNPYTDQGVHKNRLEQRSFGPGYEVTKLYQSLGNETREAVMAAIRQNQNFLNHDGHGWIDVMSCGGGGNRLVTADADTITNSGWGVLYSIGCWTTAFDYQSIGEAFVTNPNGGTVATIGNSSYGWGSPGNPDFGYSDKFDNRFWHAVTREGYRRLGDALNRAKAYYVPFSHDRNVYRWHQYCINLMGDPELLVWSAQPETLLVRGPDLIPRRHGRYLISVEHEGRPVENALVCLLKPGESYSRGRTDPSGQVWLTATPVSDGEFTLTVTADNCRPVVRQIDCRAAQRLGFGGWAVDDALGNGDGLANPGETLELGLWLTNQGGLASGPVELRLRVGSAGVTLLDSVAAHPGLGPGDSVLVAGAFRLVLDWCLADGELVRLEVSAQTASASQVFSVPLLVRGGILGPERHWLVAPLHPGRTSHLRVQLRNRGNGIAHNVRAWAVGVDSLVQVGGETLWFGEIGPRTTSTSPESISLRALPDCPASYLANLELHVAADTTVDEYRLPVLVGPSGFFDDMEQGTSLWTHGGQGDMWHHSNYRAHSGGWSWYCGSEATRQYANNMNAALTSVPLIVNQNCSLSYWRWFSVPNYGVDGIYTIVLHSGRADTLDFVGTGGALGEGVLGIQSGWAEERYDLSWLGLGETIQVQLVFRSDRDTVGEGFYIDDVRVTGGGPPAVAVAERSLPIVRELLPTATLVRGYIDWQAVTADLEADAILLDASGRKILEVQPGRNDLSSFSPGVYFLRGSAASSDRTVKKIVVAR